MTPTSIVSRISERLIEIFGAQVYTRLEKQQKRLEKQQKLRQEKQQFKEFLLKETFDLGRGPVERALREAARLANPPGFLRAAFFEPFTTERVVEIPFVRRFLASLRVPSVILEFGPGVSSLAFQAASRGHKVTTVDLRTYPYEHGNLTSLKDDFLKVRMNENAFDAAYAVSAIEHVGVSNYGGRQAHIDPYGDDDLKIVNKIHRLLKLRGWFVVTVPFGRRRCTATQRIYDRQALDTLIEPFVVEELAFFRRASRSEWVSAPWQDVHSADSGLDGSTQGVAIAKCRKT